MFNSHKYWHLQIKISTCKRPPTGNRTMVIPYVPHRNSLTSFPCFLGRISLVCIVLWAIKIVIRNLFLFSVLINAGFIWLVSNIYSTTSICSSRSGKNIRRPTFSYEVYRVIWNDHCYKLYFLSKLSKMCLKFCSF